MSTATEQPLFPIKIKSYFMRKMHLSILVIFIALKDGIHQILRQLLGKQTYNPYHWEATHHRNSTAIDRVDWVAYQHIDHRKTYAPDEASPNGSSGDAT